jgi:2,3-bisphosphoglycerate-dependent phosphoglycerate mutase
MTAAHLWLVRHGESIGNVAAARAESRGEDVIELAERDADVPLSAAGLEQAAALNRWLAADDHGIEAYWRSPYLRARQTLELALGEAAEQTRVGVDERLRDRELGILDLLTSQGVAALHPEELARRRHLGKFYHRPPGGESWADVALRLRSFLGELANREAENVMVVAHDAVVMLIVYICLGLTERELLRFAESNSVANASVTHLALSPESNRWELVDFSNVDHLDRDGASVTVHTGDDDVRPR